MHKTLIIKREKFQTLKKVMLLGSKIVIVVEQLFFPEAKFLDSYEKLQIIICKSRQKSSDSQVKKHLRSFLVTDSHSDAMYANEILKK